MCVEGVETRTTLYESLFSKTWNTSATSLKNGPVIPTHIFDNLTAKLFPLTNTKSNRHFYFYLLIESFGPRFLKEIF